MTATQGERTLMHGTCVALGPHAALLRGASGAGKSDLALRFMALTPEPGGEAWLVADDQVAVDLVPESDVPRMPPEPLENIAIAGVSLPLLRLAPFEVSAPLKLKLAILSALPQSQSQS